MIIEKWLMKKAVILKEEEKVVRQSNQIQRIKTILQGLHSEAETNKTIIIVYSIRKTVICNREIQIMEDFIVPKHRINIKRRVNTITKKMVQLI